ncbi:MAG: hypothetical protein AB7O45_15390, partial [Alphaproteobacteria bacterium]
MDAGAIAFIVDAVGQPTMLSGRDPTIPVHPAASIRLRALVPARALAAFRPVHLVPPRVLAADPALAALGPLDAVVVGKLLSIADMVRAPAAVDGLLDRLRAVATARPLVADLCDHLPAQGAVEGSDAPRRLVAGLGGLAHLTVPTEALGAELAGHARRGISVVEDPYEGEAGAPRGPRPEGPVRLAWFGLITAESARPLVAGLRTIAARRLDRP